MLLTVSLKIGGIKLLKTESTNTIDLEIERKIMVIRLRNNR